MNEIGVFEFAYPERLWWLMVVPLIVVVYWLLMLWTRRKLRRFGHKATLKELMPDYSAVSGWIKVLLFALAVGFVIIAVARPQTGSKLRNVKTDGREIVIAVDVSNSMLAEDPQPSRMDRTRYALQQLTRHMTNDHVGIVAFAEDVEVVLPITSDYKMAESKIRTLSPSLIANQGTDIGEALEVSLLSFSSNTRSSRSRVIILISDGEAHDSKALSVAELAKEEGVIICCIGIGSPEGTTLKVDGKMVEDVDGKMVVTKLNEQLLNDIASATGGIYVRSENAKFGLEEIVAELDEMETITLTHRNFEEYDEEYMWFLGAAILLLIIETFVLGRRNPLLRGVTLFDREKDK